ncbi:MAG: hypothetical protein JEZ03_17845, partial [Bacteroidales bacterium]|nr:hypothetical protein [Bacteroidales bacterium]
HVYPFLNGGEIDGQNYNGLEYTNGCGDLLKFKMSGAYFIFGGQPYTDARNPNNHNVSNTFVTWLDMVAMYQSGWGVYSHGLNGSGGGVPYGVYRTHSYMKRKLFEHSNSFVNADVRIMVNPNGASTFTDPSIDYGYLAAYNQNTGFANPFYNTLNGWPNTIDNVYRHHMSSSDESDVADLLFDASQQGSRPMASFFAHSVTKEYSFDSFKSHWQYIADTYGKEGNDAIWMTTEEEIINYLIVKDHLQMHENLDGKTLELTFSGDIRDDMRFYATSLLVDSDVDIASIEVQGATSSSYNIAFNDKGLVNVNWEGKRFIPSVIEASDWVAKAELSNNIEDALVATDYIAMIEDEYQEISLKKRLCDVFDSDLPEGFCDGLSSEITYVWTSIPEGFSSYFPSPVVEIDHTTTFDVAITIGGVTKSDQLIVTVNQVPVIEIEPFDSPLCGNQEIQLSATVENESSLLWSTSGTGIFEDSSLEDALYIPTEEDILNGGVTLKMIAYGASCAEDPIDEVSLEFIQAPLVLMDTSATICQGETFNTSAVVQNATEIMWSTSGDGDIEDPASTELNYIPGAEDIENGLVELTLDVLSDGDCGYNSSKVVELEIQKIIIVEVDSFDFPLCGNQEIQLSASVENESSLFWSTSGSGSFIDNTIEDAVYIPTEDDIFSGTVTLELLASGPSCGDVPNGELTLEFIQAPVVDVDTNGAICQGGIFNTSANVENATEIIWTTSGDGDIEDPSSTNLIYIPGAEDIENGLVELTLEVFSDGDCAYTLSKTVQLEIHKTPHVEVGHDLVFCPGNENIQLLATADDFSGVTWTSSGDGVFNDNQILNPIYTPGVDDYENGGFELFAEVNSFGDCDLNNSDSQNVIFVETISADAGVDQTVCVNDTVFLNGFCENADAFHWYVVGGEAVGVIPVYHHDTTFFLPNPEFTGEEIQIWFNAVVSSCDNYYDRDTIILNVAAQPILNAGVDQWVCYDSDVVPLVATSNGVGDFLWLSTGSGTFNDPISLSTNYIPSSEDRLNGSVDLICKTNRVDPCEGEISDQLSINFKPLPEVAILTDSIVCFDGYLQLAVVGVNYDSIYWYSAGSGDFTEVNSTQVHYEIAGDEQNQGLVRIYLKAIQADCNYEIIDSVDIQILNGPTISFINDTIQICDDDLEVPVSGVSIANSNEILWSANGNGYFDDSNLENPIFYPQLTNLNSDGFMLTVGVSGLSPCNDIVLKNIFIKRVHNPV